MNYLKLDSNIWIIESYHINLSIQIIQQGIGVCNGQVLVDLCYQEDHVADADFNVVMASEGNSSSWKVGWRPGHQKGIQ